MAGRVEIITGTERRRRWSEAEKRALVAESYGAGSGVAWVARRHGVAESCLYMWRRQYGRAGDAPRVEVPRLIAVRVEESAAGDAVSSPASPLQAGETLPSVPPPGSPPHPSSPAVVPAASSTSSSIVPAVPGGRTLVTLPDGTRIEIEAGYPVAALKALMMVLRQSR